MKKCIQAILFLTLIATGQEVCAQVAVSRDSAIVASVHRISKFLGLTANQQQSILLIEKQAAKSRDSVNRLKQSPDERKLWFAGEQAKHNRQLQSVLTAEQWTKYKKMLQERKEAFERRIKEQKIKADPLPRNN